MMRYIKKYPRDVIQCVRSTYCIDNLFIVYIYLKRNSIFKRYYAAFFDVSGSIISTVTSSDCFKGEVIRIQKTSV